MRTSITLAGAAVAVVAAGGAAYPAAEPDPKPVVQIVTEQEAPAVPTGCPGDEAAPADGGAAEPTAPREAL
ncbi:hypothetical protein C1I99_02530 [Micromonospora deserti]|uniref:D-alanyl-D-alanine carboxypeptidase n=2 Tax=Micromonospora deserti TaxID=2070366 RepID=A0A2W2CSH0_9ACTN|nr:hypothetical protein C1I99_02530 [Micromonospora deserti]